MSGGAARSQKEFPFSFVIISSFFSYQLGCGRQLREPKQLCSWAIAAVPVKNSVSTYNLDISSDYYCSVFPLFKNFESKAKGLNAIPPSTFHFHNYRTIQFQWHSSPKKCSQSRSSAARNSAWVGSNHDIRPPLFKWVNVNVAIGYSLATSSRCPPLPAIADTWGLLGVVRTTDAPTRKMIITRALLLLLYYSV